MALVDNFQFDQIIDLTKYLKFMKSMKNDQKSEYILIVDDQVDNLRLLSSMLINHGYNVRKAITGKLALTVAQAEPPELILLDLMMPGVNGYEVCKQLKSNPVTSDIPVIFLSALNNEIDKVKAFAVGGIDYISKPFLLL